MNSQDKKKITSHLSHLIEKTDFNDLLECKLIEKNVFTEDMLAERIKCAAGGKRAQNRKLYTEVQHRGPFAFTLLLEALTESGNVEAARVIDPDITVPDDHDRASKVWNPPNYRDDEPELPRPPVWMNNTTPLEVKVIKNINQTRSSSSGRTYNMESQPRGLALIIDNENFDNEVLPTRTGSLVDSNNLDCLFLQLGFNVTLRRNLGYTDMIMEIQKFSTRSEMVEVDMCVVIIMSHGRHGLIAAADGRELETEWVLRQFNNEGCPALKGKPKFFVLQSCRGDDQDFGVMPKLNLTEDNTEADARAIAFNKPPGAGKIVPDGFREVSWEDMIVAYSTLPGYVANRDKYRGTWYIECLCKVFMENAAMLEIREMLDMIAEMLKKFESEFGTKQSCAYEVRNFYKKLYFNPN